MPIYRLLQGTAFDPNAVEQIASVFEDVCRELGLAERTDPLRDTVARKVMQIALSGERDPAQLRDKTLEAIRA